MGGAVNAIGNIANAVQGIGNAISSIGNVINNISSAISSFGGMFDQFSRIMDNVSQRAREARGLDDFANLARDAGRDVGNFLDQANGQIQNVAQPFQQLNAAVSAVGRLF